MPAVARIARNPNGWRWKFVLWLTHGQIEAVPLLPHRVVHSTETVLVRLGQPGALNTVEVVSMAPQTNELVAMGSYNEMIPNTFVAVDVWDAEDGSDEGSTVRLVGTVIGWNEDAQTGRTLVLEHPDGHHMDIYEFNIDQAWWAPMGYRP